MKRKNKLKEFILSKEEFGEFKGFSIKDLLNGRILTRNSVADQLPFIMYMTFLGFIYIGNHYRVEKLMRESAKLSKELKELRYEAITTSSELMYMSKQSEVLKKIRSLNVELEELTEPPRVLLVNK